MTPTATYIAKENCLQELSQMETPERHPADIDFGSALYNYWWHRWADYNAHLATLRKIPCDPSCKGLWADGQNVVEGKDYEVRPVCIHAGSIKYAECLMNVSCEKCAMTAFPLVQAGEPDTPNIILTAFQNKPVNFLLSNALRHLTQDQQRQLCNALQERLPVPASIEDEAERLYQYHPQNDEMYTDSMVTNIQRSAHITCARQYMDTIEKLKAKIVSLEEELALYRLEK